MSIQVSVILNFECVQFGFRLENRDNHVIVLIENKNPSLGAEQKTVR